MILYWMIDFENLILSFQLLIYWDFFPLIPIFFDFVRHFLKMVYLKKNLLIVLIPDNDQPCMITSDFEYKRRETQPLKLKFNVTSV